MNLTQKLDHLRSGAPDRIPADSLRIMHRAVEDLRTSGITDGILRVGDLAPAFELPNIRGENVSSAECLGRGPLVVSFYRGFW